MYDHFTPGFFLKTGSNPFLFPTETQSNFITFLCRRRALNCSAIQCGGMEINMTEILWHGRGGQGAFTAAKLLGTAFTLRNDSSFALSFPSFGPERRGAPIRAFTKLDTKPIGNRSEIIKADFSIFLDDTLFSDAAFDEIKPGGQIILNTKHPISDSRILLLDADRLAVEILHLPITNTIMLGAFAAVYGEISLENIEDAIRENMPEKLHEKNIAAVRAAADKIRKESCK